MYGTLTILGAAAHHGGFGLHEGLLVGSTTIVVLILVGLAAVARSQIGIVPKGMGAAFEHVFDWVDGMAHDMIGHGSRQYVPLLMSFFLFILFSNWSGLLPLPVLSYTTPHEIRAPKGLSGLDAAVSEDVTEGLEHGEDSHHEAVPEQVMFEAPTASYNTTLALAMISFFAFNWYGIKKNVFPNWGKSAHSHEGDHDDSHAHSSGGVPGFFTWVLHYIQPTPMLYRSFEGGMKALALPLGVLFLCLNIMEEIARILSLSLRLFGNISGEHQVKAILSDVMRSFLGQSMLGFQQGSFVAGPAWLGVAGMIFGASLFATLLGTLAGFVQAMVFTMLSLVYIAHAVADEH